MKFATGHALNTKEIFTNFPLKKLVMSNKQSLLYSNRKRTKLIVEIFLYAIKIIIDDIIENNTTFLLPTNKKKAQIRIKRFYGDEFAQLRRAGKWEDVDILSSNFSGNQMVFELQSKEVIRTKLIYLDSKHKNRITDLTNQGKQYY